MPALPIAPSASSRGGLVAFAGCLVERLLPSGHGVPRAVDGQWTGQGGGGEFLRGPCVSAG
jgi:hypothetical protein